MMVESFLPAHRVSYFPAIHLDELLYTAVERYRQSTGRESRNLVQSELFGTVWQQPMFPIGLARLSDSLPPHPAFRVKALIAHHTLFPVYRPCMTAQGAHNTVRYMAYCTGSVQQMDFSETWYRWPQEKALRLCPECVAEQLAENGYAYWLRDHQVPGVTVCHHHHRVLVYRCPKCGPFIPPKSQTLLPSLACPTCAQRFNEDAYWSELRAIGAERYARLAHQLLLRNLPAVDSAQHRRMLMRALCSTGFANQQKVNWEGVSLRAIDHFGAPFLDALNALGDDRLLRLSKNMLELRAMRTSPIFLILLIGTIEDTVDAFLERCGEPWVAAVPEAGAYSAKPHFANILEQCHFDPYTVARLSGKSTAWEIAERAYRLRDHIQWPRYGLDPCRRLLACVWYCAGMPKKAIAARLNLSIERISRALNSSAEMNAALNTSKRLLIRDNRLVRTEQDYREQLFGTSGGYDI